MVNQSNWILKEIPQLHPLSNSYIEFWREEKKKCIEGVWISGRWMPGKLYFYINYGTIRLNKPNSKVKTYGRPWLRDLEWEFFYNWSEARGFSGFEQDTQTTCHRLVKEYYDNPEEQDIHYLKMMYPNLFTPQGTLKQYEPASSYLRKVHQHSLGKPLFENQAKNMFMLGSRGFGKDLHKDSLLHYSNDLRPISQVKVGDQIYSPSGHLVNVTNVFKFTDQLQYKLTFRDGRTVKCGAGHKWTLWERLHTGEYQLVTKELHEILENYKTYARKDSKYFLPLTSPVQYITKQLPIDPYTLGVLLGDGGLTQSVRLTTADPEILDYLTLPEDVRINKLKSKYGYSIVGFQKSNSLRRTLKDLNLLGKKSTEKVIPDIYLYGDIKQRLELLRGLLDTDGHIGKKGNITFDQSNEVLAHQVKKLCQSLGIRCTMKVRKTSKKDSYRLNILTSLEVFRLSRKKQRLNNVPSKYAQTNRSWVALTNIEPTTVEESYCISVDDPNNLFLVNEFIPTHNSYTSGVGLVLHEWLFDGKTEYVINDEKSTAEIAVAAGDAKYSKETLEKTKMALEHLPGGQEVGGLYYPAPFSKQYKGSWIPGKDVIAEYRKKEGNNWKITGTKSSIKHRTFKDNPFALNGTRLGIAIFEEVGMFPNLKESYNATIETQQDGAFKFGSMLFIGTGGDMAGGGTWAAQEMFYNPEQFDCLGFKDTWEFRSTPIGYFIPAYLGLNQFKDENGITNVAAASKFLEERRAKLRKAGSSISSLEGEIVNRPIKPSEMFLQRQGNIFPVLELRKRLSDIENSISSLEKRVSLYFDPEAKEWNGVNYKIDTSNSLVAINKFPWDETQRDGCVVIYEFPQVINDKVPEGAYIIGHDPYANDDPNGESLAATFVLKTKKYFSKIGHDEIVAAYVGRPYEGRHVVNENLYKLSRMYGNAKIYFENVRGNVKEYFEKIKRLDLLATQPKTVLTKTAAHAQTSRSIVYGYPMSSRTMKNEAIQYVRDWLLEERDSKDGIPIRNLDRIWDKALLQELISFNMDGNFDRVMGLAGCIIGLTETFNQYNVEVEQSLIKNELSTFLANNKFIFG